MKGGAVPAWRAAVAGAGAQDDAEGGTVGDTMLLPLFQHRMLVVHLRGTLV